MLVLKIIYYKDDSTIFSEKNVSCLDTMVFRFCDVTRYILRKFY